MKMKNFILIVMMTITLLTGCASVDYKYQFDKTPDYFEKKFTTKIDNGICRISGMFLREYFETVPGVLYKLVRVKALDNSFKAYDELYIFESSKSKFSTITSVTDVDKNRFIDPNPDFHIDTNKMKISKIRIRLPEGYLEKYKGVPIEFKSDDFYRSIIISPPYLEAFLNKTR
jgi:hypothetical protein